ncbi:MAG TPA: MFS transporter, partial [Cellvibrionaceae bacterium]|nr:MFS transporter [Cellvibrionaceae bacterium]
MLPINLFAFHEGKIKILHLTWFAFFITFIMWFSQASLLPFIKQAFALTDGQVKALLILNVALTIP